MNGQVSIWRQNDLARATALVVSARCLLLALVTPTTAAEPIDVAVVALNQECLLCEAVESYLLSQLNSSKSARAVEGNALRQIMQEQRLSLTGVVDPDEFVRAGRLLGADLDILENLTQVLLVTTECFKQSNLQLGGWIEPLHNGMDSGPV